MKRRFPTASEASQLTFSDEISHEVRVLKAVKQYIALHRDILAKAVMETVEKLQTEMNLSEVCYRDCSGKIFSPLSHDVPWDPEKLDPKLHLFDGDGKKTVDIHLFHMTRITPSGFYDPSPVTKKLMGKLSVDAFCAVVKQAFEMEFPTYHFYWKCLPSAPRLYMSWKNPKEEDDEDEDEDDAKIVLVKKMVLPRSVFRAHKSAIMACGFKEKQKKKVQK